MGEQVRAGVYVRISQDEQRQGLGVRRQEQDCRALAERRGWTVVEVWNDNDLTASGKKRRPGYEAMCAAIKAGEVGAVVAWTQDRIVREMRELEDFIDLVDATGCQVDSVRSGEIDLTTPDGRFVARIKGAMARAEWEKTRDRQQRKQEELRDDRKPRGDLGYAYGPGGVLDRERAAVFREVAQRVLDGEPLTRIADDLNDRDVPTKRGGRWASTTIKTMLSAPSAAGLVVHRGRVVGEGTWPAVIDRVTWERVRAALDRPGHRAHRRYLLSGLVACAECGRPLVGTTRYTRRGEPVPAYACVKARGGCGGVYVTAAPVEAAVESRMSAALADGTLAGRLRPVADVATEQQIADEEAKLAEYAAMLDAGDLELVEWRQLRSAVLARLDALRATMASADTEAQVRALAGRGWDDLTVLEQRLLIGRFLDVRVSRRVAGGPRFDASRLSLRWRP